MYLKTVLTKPLFSHSHYLVESVRVLHGGYNYVSSWSRYGATAKVQSFSSPSTEVTLWIATLVTPHLPEMDFYVRGYPICMKIWSTEHNIHVTGRTDSHKNYARENDSTSFRSNVHLISSSNSLKSNVHLISISFTFIDKYSPDWKFCMYS